MTNPLYDRAADARLKIDARLARWMGRKDHERARDYSKPLAELLGYKSVADLRGAMMTDVKVIETVEKLAGPHGHTIYKTLLARSSTETVCNN